jgi:DNA polymerase I-like protein with 3'-5' exonuclease and polymerase domains
MDGWRLFELDLAQAELRVATMIAECELMHRMIVNGEDLHTFTTRALFPQISEDDPSFKSKWRQVGKRGNFSLQFGSGGTTFRKMVSKETGIQLTDHEAERIVRDWNGLYPEFSKAIKKHMHVVEKRQQQYGHGWVAFFNQERRWFQQYEEAHKAFNQRVQGNLGQFAIDWMLLTNEYLRKQGLDKEQAGLVLTIHDSQVLLLPDGAEGEKMAATCAQFGRDLWKEWFSGIPGDVDYHSWEYAA